MTDLVLHLKTKYFRQIAAGEKREEYRLCKPYWAKRLVNRRYDRLVIWDAYKPGSAETVLIFPYRGYEIRTITHEHFGKIPAKVFVIPLTSRQSSNSSGPMPGLHESLTFRKASAQFLCELLPDWCTL